LSILADISAAIADLEGSFGEEVTIGSWTGTAIVSGGGLNFEAVAGGTYEGALFTIVVRKEVLPDGFAPEPPMPVSARGYDLRIVPDGVSDFRAHYRIAVAARDVPSKLA
jgi:hypothetical protein